MPRLASSVWRLVYPGVDFTFGDSKPYHFASAPDLGAIEPATQDAAYAAADGVAFGRDYLPGRTISFELTVNEWSPWDNLEAHNALLRAWRGDSIRRTPGAVAELYVSFAGRERVVYGRPRNYASLLDQNIDEGLSGATLTFACADSAFYDAAETAITVGLIPPSSGGLLAPLAAPLSTAQVVNRPGLITTTGQVEAWPVVTIFGPVTNPKVELTDEWYLQLNTTLAFDQSVTIDTRPWARTVLRNDGASLAGKLTRGSVPLAQAVVAPATASEVVYSGIDQSGTSRVTVAWRNAWAHI